MDDLQRRLDDLRRQLQETSLTPNTLNFIFGIEVFGCCEAMAALCC